MTTAASTTMGRIGAVQPQPPGVTRSTSGVTVRTEKTTAPKVIAHVPADSVRSAERICSGVMVARRFTRPPPLR